ncbi:MAG: ribbon-helix-helix protein, CopG family [archaeon]|nr:ribbon-helix-helix protein, CopG family [archaeon]
MPKRRDGKMNLTAEIDEKTYKIFKKLCIDNDITMSQMLRKLVREWIDIKKK